MKNLEHNFQTVSSGNQKSIRKFSILVYRFTAFSFSERCNLSAPFFISGVTINLDFGSGKNLLANRKSVNKI
jgi:hypothetical protein